MTEPTLEEALKRVRVLESEAQEAEQFCQSQGVSCRDWKERLDVAEKRLRTADSMMIDALEREREKNSRLQDEYREHLLLDCSEERVLKIVRAMEPYVETAMNLPERPGQRKALNEAWLAAGFVIEDGVRRYPR